MLLRMLLAQLVLLCLLGTDIVTSCVIQLKHTGQHYMNLGLEYNEKLHSKRKLHESKCRCGVDRKVDLKMWDVYVHVLTSSFDRHVCTGTVIAHNMVITSHKCLLMKGRTSMGAYEVWRPYPENRVRTVARAEYKQVFVSPATDDDYKKYHFDVLEVIYNERYGVYGAAGDSVASGQDIALLIVDTDFFDVNVFYDDENDVTGEPFVPLCIPTASNRQADVIHKFGYYYGFGGDFDADSSPEDRTVRKLVILDGSECDEERDFGSYSKESPFCARFLSPPPKHEGGPLVTTNEPIDIVKVPVTDENGKVVGLTIGYKISPLTSFLIGINTKAVKRQRGYPITYSYFGNVLKHIGYIENIASEYGSLWCETPQFNWNSPITTAPPEKIHPTEWPWQTTNPGSITRDKSLDCKCGVKGKGKNERIVNGEDAAMHEFGWQAKLFFTFKGNWDGGYSVCGGSLINDRVVLTAGHCVVGGGRYFVGMVQLINVTVGGHFLDDDKSEILLKVEKIIPHPGYVPGLYEGITDSDLALLILEERIDFHKTPETIKPICIPESNQYFDVRHGTALASGYGLTENGDLAPSLRKVELPLVAMQDCADRVWGTVSENVICAGTLDAPANNDPIKDTGPGDSGGALIKRKEKHSDQYFQVGVVSFALGSIYDPTIYIPFYANVQKFLPFIEYYSDMYEAKWCKN